MEKTLRGQAAESFSRMIPSVSREIRKFESTNGSALTPLQDRALKLSAEAGALPMNEIASRMQMSKQQLTRFIDSLVRKGYLERSFKENNRRTIFIRITQTGINAISGNYQSACDFHAREFEKLSDEDTAALRDCSDRLVEILSKL
jgi:DNA-binding MarR family transcriptional regulator